MSESWKMAGIIFVLFTADALNLGVFYMGSQTGLLHHLVTRTIRLGLRL